MNDREVARYWNENAAAWTELSRAGYDVYRDSFNTPAFFDMTPPIRGLAGVDIGCGEGHNTRLLAKAGARVSAIDVSEAFIAQAVELEKTSPLGIEYRLASAAAIPFGAATFDFATAFMSFMDMPEVRRAQNAHRKKGERFVREAPGWCRRARRALRPVLASVSSPIVA